MSARKPAIHFTSEADDDLKSISLYTWRNWGEEQATIYEAMIGRALDLLREHPRLGQPRDDLFPGCRSVQVEQHVIYYHQPQTTEIEVLRILHSRQDASAAVNEPSDR
jgi:toxin ParE1/3/4